MSNLRKEYNLHKKRRIKQVGSLIEASIKMAINEQQAEAPPVEPPPVATPQNQAQTPAAPAPETVPRQYTVDNMIEELNAIRGGRSFTDPEVYGKLVTFFKNLGDEQKSTLDQLLTQIAELVTSVDDAPAPNQSVPQTTGAPPAEAPQQSAPMPGAQPAAGAAGVGVA